MFSTLSLVRVFGSRSMLYDEIVGRVLMRRRGSMSERGGAENSKMRDAKYVCEMVPNFERP